MPPPLNACANGPYLRRQYSPRPAAPRLWRFPPRPVRWAPATHCRWQASGRRRRRISAPRRRCGRASCPPRSAPSSAAEPARRALRTGGRSAGSVGTSPACDSDEDSGEGVDDRAAWTLFSDSVTCCSCPTSCRSCRRMDSSSSCRRPRRSSSDSEESLDASSSGACEGIGAPQPAQKRPTEMFA